MARGFLEILQQLTLPETNSFRVWLEGEFPLGFFVRLFSGAIAVSFREGSQSKEPEKNGTQKNS